MGRSFVGTRSTKFGKTQRRGFGEILAGPRLRNRESIMSNTEWAAQSLEEMADKEEAPPSTEREEAPPPTVPENPKPPEPPVPPPPEEPKK
jgi:hypothetical protein